MKSSTVSSSFTLNLIEGASQAGHDIDTLLLDSNISPALLQQPGSRVTYLQQSKLSLALMELMQDEMMGLLDRPIKPHTFKMLAYGAINAKTVGDAIKIWEQATKVLDIGLQMSVQYDEQQAYCTVRQEYPGQMKNAYAVEHCLFTYHRMLCWLADQMIPIAAVELEYSKPDYAEEYRRLFINAPIRYDCERSKIVFSRRVLAVKNIRDFTQLKEFLRQMPLNMFSTHYDALHFSAKIRQWLERCLIKNNQLPDIIQTAEHFQSQPQTLRRTLAKEGITFKEIKSATQRDFAIDLINNEQKSVEAMAFELGFSERAAFIRAFKRWTGLTPLAYRKLSQASAENN